MGYTKCTIVFETNGSVTLKQNILELFEEMYNFHPLDVLGNFERVFSDKAKTDDFARRAMNDSDVLGVSSFETVSILRSSGSCSGPRSTQLLSSDATNIQAIFTPSKDFYWRWSTSPWAKHFVNSTRGEATANGGYRSDVADHCHRAWNFLNTTGAKWKAISVRQNDF